MQKLLNAPEAFVDEALEGFVLANSHAVRRLVEEPRAIVRAVAPNEPRVAVATGGGFGHLPLFVGYVATGFVDGCAVGNMFASPSTEVMLAVTRAIDAGRGVMYVYGNYGGDRLNFEAAAELAGAAAWVLITAGLADVPLPPITGALAGDDPVPPNRAQR